MKNGWTSGKVDGRFLKIVTPSKTAKIITTNEQKIHQTIFPFFNKCAWKTIDNLKEIH